MKILNRVEDRGHSCFMPHSSVMGGGSSIDFHTLLVFVYNSDQINAGKSPNEVVVDMMLTVIKHLGSTMASIYI